MSLVRKPVFTAIVSVIAGFGFCAANAATVSHSVEVQGSSSAVWALIGPFCAIKNWLPPVGSCSHDGATRPTRTLVTKDGSATFVERQTARNNARHFYSYTFLSSPLPVTHYHSTIKVTSLGHGQSNVTWTGTYTPVPGQENAAREALDGIYVAGLESILDPEPAAGFAMSKLRTCTGSCFCGDVQFVLTGEPVAMGYCHCDSCRHWSAGPVNAFTLWNPTALKITSGATSIAGYSKTPNSNRKWCTTCGGHLFTIHPAAGLIDVYAALIPQLTFEPGIHVHYQESVLPMNDGLPKMKDMPAEMGGSGMEIPE